MAFGDIQMAACPLLIRCQNSVHSICTVCILYNSKGNLKDFPTTIGEDTSSLHMEPISSISVLPKDNPGWLWECKNSCPFLLALSVLCLQFELARSLRFLFQPPRLHSTNMDVYPSWTVSQKKLFSKLCLIMVFYRRTINREVINKIIMLLSLSLLSGLLSLEYRQLLSARTLLRQYSPLFKVKLNVVGERLYYLLLESNRLTMIVR